MRMRPAAAACLAAGILGLSAAAAWRCLPCPLAEAPPAERALGLARAADFRARDWQALPGVGPVLAGRLAAFARRDSGLRRWEDLLAVPGVGPGTLAKIRRALAAPAGAGATALGRTAQESEADQHGENGETTP